MTERLPINHEAAKPGYWDKRQDDITIIFLNKREQNEELEEIEEIEKELGIQL